jgi:hypothetical protein
MPEKGWIFPVWTKFGTCYTSAFTVVIPVFTVAFMLPLTYRESWIPGRSIGDNLRDQRAAQDRDLNFWRAVVFFVAEILILWALWRLCSSIF